MGTEYVYANKALESAVKELKSSFFDIFYHSQGTLLMLMKQLDELEVEDEALKEEAVDLINSQGTLLSDSMSLVEELIRSIKKIDNNGKKIDKFNRSYVVSNGKSFTKVEKVGIEAQTEPVTEVQTEPVTEAQTEPVTEVQTDPVTEVQTEPVTEAQTEPVTEAQTEPVTEAQTEPVTETQTEPVTETQTEETTEVSTTLTGLEVDPNAPVEFATEPVVEKQKKYIADTPEGVNKDLKQALLTMPGMENLKFDSQGRPDFSSVLPQDVLDDFNSKFGFQVSVKRTLDDADKMESVGATEAIVPNEGNVDLPFAIEPVIPTPAPPAPPTSNSINQSELKTKSVIEETTEVATEVKTEATTEVQTEAVVEAVIPGAEVVMPEVATEETTEVQTEAVAEAVIPGAEVVMPEVATEATTEVQTEAVVEAVIPGVEVVMPEVATEVTTEVAMEASSENSTEMPGVQVAMPTEEANINNQILPFGEVATEPEIPTEVVTEAPTEDNSIRKFNDQSANVKAMLVSDNQYNKLVGSRVTQEALLTFKKILPEKSHGATHLVTVDASQTVEASVDNMTADEKNKTIEAMMIDANNLYNAGKVAEAQALYDKISEINKTLVKS